MQEKQKHRSKTLISIIILFDISTNAYAISESFLQNTSNISCSISGSTERSISLSGSSNYTSSNIESIGSLIGNNGEMHSLSPIPITSPSRTISLDSTPRDTPDISISEGEEINSSISDSPYEYFFSLQSSTNGDSISELTNNTLTTPNVSVDSDIIYQEEQYNTNQSDISVSLSGYDTILTDDSKITSQELIDYNQNNRSFDYNYTQVQLTLDKTRQHRLHTTQRNNIRNQLSYVIKEEEIYDTKNYDFITKELEESKSRTTEQNNITSKAIQYIVTDSIITTIDSLINTNMSYIFAPTSSIPIAAGCDDYSKKKVYG